MIYEIIITVYIQTSDVVIYIGFTRRRCRNCPIAERCSTLFYNNALYSHTRHCLYRRLLEISDIYCSIKRKKSCTTA